MTRPAKLPTSWPAAGIPRRMAADLKKYTFIFLAVLISISLLGGCAESGPTQTTAQEHSNPGESPKKTTTPLPSGQKEPKAAPANRSPLDTERFTDNGDQTVTDHQTGLTWQKGEVFDITAEQTRKAASELTTGGYQDWRVPTMLELLSIVNVGLNKPPFPDILGLSASEYFWSSESTPGVADKVWVLNAGGGTGNKRITDSRAAGGEKIYSLKCVRGQWTIPSPRYTANDDQTVADNLLQLVWQPTVVPGLSLSEAKAYIDQLNANSPFTWRLPTMPELAMLCDRSQNDPAVDRQFFPDLSPDKVWTSSALSAGGKQWYVDLSTGMTTYDPPESKHAVLAVRAMN